MLFPGCAKDATGQVLVTVGSGTTPAYFSGGVGYMANSSVAMDSGTPTGSYYLAGLRRSASGAVYCTSTSASTDAYIQGVRVTALGQVVIAVGAPVAQSSGNPVSATGVLATSVGAVAGFDPADEAVTALYLDSRDLSDGAVASWVSRDRGAQTVIQSTGANQPTKGVTGVVFDGSTDVLSRASEQSPTYVTGTTLPDGASSATAGKGWTNTGMVRLSDGTFWISNHGKALGADATFLPSLVHVSANFSTILSEILLAPLYPGIGTVQGVVYDTSDDTLWFADANNEKVRHITTAGVVIAGDEITASFRPNGIARDPADDGMWIWEEEPNGNGFEKRSCVDGTVTEVETSLNLGGNDHLYYDATNKVLYASYGTNGTAGKINIYSTALSPMKLIGTIRCPVAQVDAVEGLAIYGNTLYVNNDGYFHSGAVPFNRVVELDVVPPAANISEFWGIFTVPLTTGRDQLLGIGNAVANSTVGIGLYATSATTLRLYGNSGATGITTQNFVDATTPSLTVPRIIYGRIDQTNDAVTLWVDGTQIGTASGSALVGAMGFGGTLYVGNAADNAAASMTTLACGINMGQGDRQKIEGYLAHQFSLTAQLPADHPHKTVAP